MTRFTGYAIFKGQGKRKHRKPYDLGDFNGLDAGQDFIAALSALAQIVNAEAVITESTIIETGLNHVATTATAANTGDVFNKGLLVVRIPSAENPQKTANLYIPAVAPDVMVGLTDGDFDVMDTANADLIDYVNQMSQHAFVSDGEQIDTGVNNGMVSGRRIVSSYKS